MWGQETDGDLVSVSLRACCFRIISANDVKFLTVCCFLSCLKGNYFRGPHVWLRGCFKSLPFSIIILNFNIFLI